MTSDNWNTYEELPPKRQEVSLGNLTLICESFMYREDGFVERGDTRIDIGGENLCWVAGAEFDQFIKDLRDLIGRHRI